MGEVVQFQPREPVAAPSQAAVTQLILSVLITTMDPKARMKFFEGLQGAYDRATDSDRRAIVKTAAYVTCAPLKA